MEMALLNLTLNQNWSNLKTISLKPSGSTAEVGFFTLNLNGLLHRNGIGMRVEDPSFSLTSVIFQYQACDMQAYTRKDILTWDF